MRAILANVPPDDVLEVDADRRRICAFAILSLVMLAGIGLLRVSAPSPFAPRVNVRWAAEISETRRIDLERRFGLVDGSRREGMTWAYDLSDPSPSVVRALIGHPAVEDTYHIDRRSGELDPDVPRGTTQLPQQRMALWIDSMLFDWFTLFWVSSFVVSGVWLASARNAARG